jgi:uncharacterized protein
MIFLDTSFVVAYYNENDEHHFKAVNIMRDLVLKKYGEMIISDYIFDEFVTVMLTRTKNINKTIRYAEDLRKFTLLLFVEKILFELSWRIFKNQKNTKLSFTDCSILAVMEQEGIRNIVTFDEDLKKIEGIKIIE